VKTTAETVIIANPTSWSLPVACQHQSNSASVTLFTQYWQNYGK